uniref:Protein kinase domain-containing protein n=1 Tax=Physcomitrium patens TaxID=3218 RepID=A0A2K1L3S1_PHYPA|nr:hypothetical protein PHYPA_003468 [Physcomitrium patens]
MLEEVKEAIYVFFIDIMHQIKKRIYYFYDMHIVHCNLKPYNILVSIIELKIINKIILHAIVSIIDFRMSKIYVERNPRATKNNYIYNSSKYMAPKALKNRF